MDIAKYIGLYLLKNQTCYVHGLGNIEIRRKPASYDGRNLVPGVSEVVVVPANTVDDSLSNFIATNEQISISKASNALKDYATNAMADVQAGREVLIPAIGSFFQVNDKLQFATAPQLLLTPPPIPTEKNLPRRNTGAATSTQAPSLGYQQEQQAPAYMAPPVATMQVPAQPYPQMEEEKKGGLNWGRIILFVLILLALIGGVAYVAKNILKIGGGAPAPVQQQQPMTVPAPADTIGAAQRATDTTQLIDTSNSMVVDESIQTPTPPVVNKGPIVNYKVIINTYDERERAEKRLHRLRSYGHQVELIAEDSNTYRILVPISMPRADSVRVMDSLERTYNPNGVFIY